VDGSQHKEAVSEAISELMKVSLKLRKEETITERKGPGVSG
jgi:hypothetical protein